MLVDLLVLPGHVLIFSQEQRLVLGGVRPRFGGIELPIDGCVLGSQLNILLFVFINLLQILILVNLEFYVFMPKFVQLALQLLYLGFLRVNQANLSAIGGYDNLKLLRLGLEFLNLPDQLRVPGDLKMSVIQVPQ